MKSDSLAILNLIAQTIYDKKGSNIFVLDARNFSTLTDYFIIAEGSADRHVQGLCLAIIEAMRTEGIYPLHIEGREMGDWIVIDFFNIVIHLFMPGMREKYSLEELWQKGSIVDVKIKITGDSSRYSS